MRGVAVRGVMGGHRWRGLRWSCGERSVDRLYDLTKPALFGENAEAEW